MQINEDLIRKIIDTVIEQINQSESAKRVSSSSEIPSMAGRDRINEKKTSYVDYPRAKKGTDPKEIVIGVGAAFQMEIKKTICGIPLEDVLRSIKAGIEEEGMNARVVKIWIPQMYVLWRWKRQSFPVQELVLESNLKVQLSFIRKTYTRFQIWNCFPQAPLMTLEIYRQIGKNAAKYVKGEQVVPIPCTNDPMSRPKYQVKAALMHIAETEQLDPEVGIIEWEGK